MPQNPVVKDMAISHAEFSRLIKKLGVPIRQLTNGATYMELQWGGGRVEVQLGPEMEQRLGSLRLIRTRVELMLIELPQAEGVAFLERFDRCFQRAGG